MGVGGVAYIPQAGGSLPSKTVQETRREMEEKECHQAGRRRWVVLAETVGSHGSSDGGSDPSWDGVSGRRGEAVDRSVRRVDSHPSAITQADGGGDRGRHKHAVF